MSVENYQIDSLDRAILRALQQDAKRPYLDIARELDVSGGTVHMRINRLREAGVIEGTQLKLNRRKLGLDVLVLIGVHLTSAKAVTKVLERLKKFPEVLDVFYTTGNYSLILKVVVPSIDGYHQFLIKKLQSIDEVQSTESFICMDQPLERDISIPDQV